MQKMGVREYPKQWYKHLTMEDATKGNQQMIHG